MKSTGWRSFVIFGGAIAATVATAWAYTYIFNAYTGLPYILASGQTTMQVKLGSTTTLSDGSNYNTSFKAAADSWNALIGSTQINSQLSAPGAAGNHNGINEAVFASSVFGKSFDANTLAVTTTWVSGNTRTEGDIVFNSSRTWDSYTGNLRSGAVDLHRVALHELGHLLGLDHPDEAGQNITPSPIMNSVISNRDSLTSDDITGVQNLYGPPGVPANDNFANAISLSPTSGTKLTVQGYNTNATRETGEPFNAGNFGGHSVWWKWQAPAAGNVTIDTRGSYYDTTLGIYTGTTLATLVPVTSNDDIDPGKVQASTVSFATTAGTTYYLSVDGFDGDNAGITLNLSYSVTGSGAPAIFTQPASATVNVGQSASFSVTATGDAPLSYQWQFNGAAIPGATNANYAINNVQLGQGGSYTVVVSNNLGTTTSNAATLTVNTPASGSTAGGGGGGGAPSIWFLAALGALGLARRLGLLR